MYFSYYVQQYMRAYNNVNLLKGALNITLSVRTSNLLRFQLLHFFHCRTKRLVYDRIRQRPVTNIGG